MEERFHEILKWIGLAFAAGFIGYFGRYLSMAIIDRVKKRRQNAEASTSRAFATQQAAEPAQPVQDDKISKLEKKRLKTEIKKAKKQAKE